MEKQAAGNWFVIGYTGPGVANSSSARTSVISYDGADSTIWKASAISALNDCEANKGWKLTATVSGTTVAYEAGGDAKCTVLTPSWSNFTRKAAAEDKKE